VDRREELAAVLFDMDGTLLDSERLWDDALRALAAHHGGVLSPRARRAMVGRDETGSMAIFYRDLGLTRPDPRADTRFLDDLMIELFTTELTWLPGARELVTQVRQAGVPTALVTSTPRRLVEVALEHILGRDRFDVVVCGNEVTEPKPHPESYRTAAARLSAPVARCVAIEDSPAGIASARAAGAVVVGVPATVDLSTLDGVHLVPSLLDVDLTYLSRLVAPA
jgi:HAD superfamily hydrolase (TIGR01509 family)